ncbi:MAG: aminoacetone oxidase family FAD-binding enzyme [Rhodobacteraceae bacterium]|nr:aminoacetone oxidase family FAD-binding enzyme [Paracoccaceae bacterium]
MDKRDVVIIGAGAAGMMCGIVAAKRGRSVLLVDHAHKIGEKIRISGGGRCNFTNLGTQAAHFLCSNRHFVKSALGRYPPQDFVDMVESHGIGWVEKAQGQLFCDGKASLIVDMLKAELAAGGAEIWSGTSVDAVEEGFVVQTSRGAVQADSLVVASGGKSIPKIGASGLGYDIARQFGLSVLDTRAGLVPLTFGAQDLVDFREMAGVAVPVSVRCGAGRFADDLLFTHRGLSGPAILQISSFWREGMALEIDLLPAGGLSSAVAAARAKAGGQAVQTMLARLFPKKLARFLAGRFGFSGTISDLSKADIAALETLLRHWQVQPTGTEGYRTAEVTLGGVDTNALDAKTMQARNVPGLFFIGEVVDVTGWLGGYNFQWAWASGAAAGQVA